ncbi:ATP-binding protein [Nakamurella deserti]|uniref:ATP-binding protein n=1 Tax=Nakamurella deserti TaxID=2164074 RepID=UPI000DBE28DB|nr:ATP-binding protein [Nakamurella deserti]
MTADTSTTSASAPTAGPAPAGGEAVERIDRDELRSLFLFRELSDEQLGWLQERGHVAAFPAGPVYVEGDEATCFYVLLDGGVALSRRVGADDIEVNRTTHRGVYSGAMQAYLENQVPQVYTSSLTATEPSRFFVLDAALFAEFMRQWFPMALHLLEGLFFGIRNMNEATEQRERLLALGSLSAGLTHELNNPAAAAVRATSALRDRVGHMRHKLRMIAEGTYDREVLVVLIKLQEDATDRVRFAPDLTPLQVNDAEDELGDWLDGHGIADAWELAPTFVQAGLDTDWLDQMAGQLPPDVLEGATRWLMYTLETELLMSEIFDSTTRISTLVGAAKQYSQMDRAPFQPADVNELLKSTLVMLYGKFGGGITVVKDLAPGLPKVPAYAAELNQVWTNIIDNAVSAMGGTGTLTLRTALVGDHVHIEIGDTGPGIPAEVRGRIFEPFFTTKPVGEGTGLGLDISWRIIVKRHHGDLSVTSSPGDTRFLIRLPLHPAGHDLPSLDGAIPQPEES